MSDVPEPSWQERLSDGMWVDAWIYDGDATCPRSYNKATGLKKGESSRGRLCIDRHKMGIDLAYLDTQVKYSNFGAFSKVRLQSN